jgi:ATP-dependent Clp protease adaptor protein ClpS
MADKNDEKGSGGEGSKGGDAAGAPAAATKSKRRAATKRRPPKKLPPYNVVLLNDDDHSYDYVIEMLAKVFAHPPERGMQMAKEVDESGRVICLTTHKELAELKRDQIVGYGIDPRVATCKGSMGAVIEPAEG